MKYDKNILLEDTPKHITLYSVITTWQVHELVRWKRHWHHFI